MMRIVACNLLYFESNSIARLTESIRHRLTPTLSLNLKEAPSRVYLTRKCQIMWEYFKSQGSEWQRKESLEYSRKYHHAEMITTSCKNVSCSHCVFRIHQSLLSSLLLESKAELAKQHCYLTITSVHFDTPET